MLVLYTENAPLAPRPIEEQKWVCQCTTAVPQSFEDTTYKYISRLADALLKSNLQFVHSSLKRYLGENHIIFIKISSILWKINQPKGPQRHKTMTWRWLSVSWDVGHFVQHGMSATLFTHHRPEKEWWKQECWASCHGCFICRAKHIESVGSMRTLGCLVGQN